jgi:peptide methionine sulfoxide reductase MsrA
VNEKIRLLEEKNNWNIQIHRGPVTESGIYKAEEYHQRFFEKNPGSAW